MVFASNINKNNTSSKSNYRPEIDGLRALAVIAVIINHINKDILPSGYLGVDIFFVISGFVITSSLAGRSSESFGDFITGFYVRRIKRIIPALAIFVLLTSIAVCIFSPIPERSLSAGARSLIGISNLYFFQQATDYWGAAADLNVFTHTWSLGVEEQFYFIFPLVIWFTGFGRQTTKGSSNLLWITGILSIASLIGFVYFYQTLTPFAYFSMPTRFWEMCSGCLLFLILKRSARFSNWVNNFSPLVITMTMMAIFFVPLQFAVQATIAIVILTGILIACLKEETNAYRYFAHPKIVFIGLISYSLYLWHWSVLSLSRWTIGIHWWSIPFQVSLMFLLAVISYRYIETPLRRSQWSSVRWKSIGYGIVVSIFTGLILFGFSKNNELLFAGTKNFSSAESELITESVCLEDRAEKNNNYQLFSKPCLTDASSFVVLGDSHVGTVAPIFRFLRKEKGIGIAYQEFGQVFPSARYTNNKNNTKQRWISQNEEANKFLDRSLPLLSPGDTVVSSSFLARIFVDRTLVKRYMQDDLIRYDRDWKQIDVDRSLALWKEEVDKLASRLAQKSLNLLIIAPTPVFAENTPELCREEWFKIESTEECSKKFAIERKTVLDKIENLNQTLSLLQRKNSNVYVYNAFPILCPPSNSTCSVNSGDTQMYIDEHHLSLEGSLSFKQDFVAFLQGHNLLR